MYACTMEKFKNHVCCCCNQNLFFYINWNGFLLRFIHFLSVQNAEKILSRSSIDQKLVFFSIDNINTIESFWQAVEHSEKETNR